MTYNRKLLSKFNLVGKAGFPDLKEVDQSAMEEVMADPNYLRQSSSLINEALQKGFDVLQLADGDIVTTGVKTVVYQYTWDDEKGKLVRTSAKAKKAKKQAEVSSEEV